MKINKRGISLITLVIAIIIMIILAGAIIMTLNNIGIFDRANEAVTKYNLKEVQAIAELAWVDAYKGPSTTVSELQAAVDEALVKNNLDDKYEAIADEKGVTVTLKDPNAISSLGELIKGPDDYGKTVSYWTEVNNEIFNEWKVFYEDQKNGYIFLIASSPTVELMAPDSYSLKWSQLDSKKLELYDIFTLGKHTYGLSDADDNSASIAVLVNYYDAYANTEEYGKYVIGAMGGPTIELLLAGYNSKYNDNVQLVIGEGGYYLNEVGTYKISTNENDKLYTNGADYWLASPSPYENDLYLHGLIVAGSGKIQAGDYYYECLNGKTHGYGLALRPVVCLRSDIPARLNGNVYDINVSLK